MMASSDKNKNWFRTRPKLHLYRAASAVGNVSGYRCEAD